MRTADGSGNPAELRSLICISSGQASLKEVVIIVMMLCSASLLKCDDDEMISAGRFFDSFESVNGNGTTTTSNVL